MTVVSTLDYFPATVTAKLSAECNFRELDDAFLQTQTRIWLGEVLQRRLDEATDISDILADGKFLSELSEVLSRMLPSLSIDATQSKTNDLKSFVSSKSTQRYMPYYNVGSFLKMCKNLGLDGIDLFTPSDVVEKRNTRKVCMCIRSLSKRARSRDLNVPDFDSVTCTLTMPTNMVECIRKSLEMSQSSSSISVGLEVDKVASIMNKNKISNSASTVSNEYSSSDICDDAESSFIVSDFNGPSDYTHENESPNMSCSEVIGDFTASLQLNTRILENEEDDQCEYLSPSIGESVSSPCSHYFSDQDVGTPTYDFAGSHISSKLDAFSKVKPKYQNDVLLHVPIEWGDDRSDLENNSDDNVNNDESNCEIFLEDGFGTSGIPVPGLDISELGVHKLVIGESFCDGKALLVEKTSHFSRNTENLEFSCEDDNLKPLICTEVIDEGINSCCESLNKSKSASIDLSGETSFPVEQPSSLLAVKSNGIVDHLISPNFADEIGMLGKLLHGNDSFVSVNTDNSMAKYDKDAFDAYKKSSDNTEQHLDRSNSLASMESGKDSKICSEHSQGAWVIPEGHIPELADDLVLNEISTSLDDPLMEIETSRSMEDADHNCLQCIEDTEKGKTEHIKQEETTKETPQHKPKRKLLKSVAQGSALLGIAVFLLHLRKHRQPNLSRVKKQPVEVLKKSAPTPSPTKDQKGGKTNSIYPAEKLKFGF